jgi:hypothetical protein
MAADLDRRLLERSRELALHQRAGRRRDPGTSRTGHLPSLACAQRHALAQEWGSLIGLRLAAEHRERFARIVIANGFVPTGEGAVPAAFRVWRAFARYSPLFPIGRIIASGCVVKLSSEVRAAYDAPFPDRAHKVGARVFPKLVPVEADNPAVPANRAAWAELAKWDKPFLTLFGKNDPILGRGDRQCRTTSPAPKVSRMRGSGEGTSCRKSAASILPRPSSAGLPSTVGASHR